MESNDISFSIIVDFLEENKSYRSCRLNVSDERIKNSHHLSCYDLEMTNEVIKSLENIINNKRGEYDWGTEQILITSEPEISTLEDYMYEESLPSVKTSLLLDFMKEWQLFQLRYGDEEFLQQIVKKAYNTILSNPKKYIQKGSKIDYDICIDGILVGLQLVRKQGDFKLSPDEYVNQIKRISW